MAVADTSARRSADLCFIGENFFALWTETVRTSETVYICPKLPHRNGT